jgi:hypothetical protein
VCSCVCAGSEDITWTEWIEGLRTRPSLVGSCALRLLEGDWELGCVWNQRGNKQRLDNDSDEFDWLNGSLFYLHGF